MLASIKEIKLRKYTRTSQELKSLGNYLLCSSSLVYWISSFSNICLVLVLKLQSLNPWPSTSRVQPWLTLFLSISSQCLGQKSNWLSLGVAGHLTLQPRWLHRGWVVQLYLVCPFQAMSEEGPLGRKCMVVNGTGTSSTKSSRGTTGTSNQPFFGLALLMFILYPFHKWFPMLGIYFMFPQIIACLKFISNSSFINYFLCQVTVTI